MLDAGTWNLLVTAYLDLERTQPIAQGSISKIEITPGGEKTGSVTLSQITVTGSGEGTFSWDIDYPDDVTKASMAITRLSGNNETLLDTWYFKNTDLYNKVDDEDSIPLEAGYYRVVFTLTNDADKSVEWREILHIYDGRDSAFEHEFTSNQFLYVIYTVTFVSNSGSSVPSQSVFKNTLVARPVNPTRSGQNFTGWYSNSGLTTLYDFSAPVTENITLYAGWHTAGAAGIYVGIIKYANVVNNVPTANNAPVLLSTNNTNRTTLTSALTSDYTAATEPGTALFYAVHKALANLKATEFSYPTNIDSVNIITFTDGLDLFSSTGLSALPASRLEEQQFYSNTEYAEYVSGEIENRTIAGLPITAYSVGVPGSDVNDIPAFQNNLVKIASPDKNQELANYSDVQSTLSSIADGLISSLTSTSIKFTMVTPYLYPNGTTVRMTFNSNTDPDSAGASQRYIEGTVSEVGGTYTFTNITYGGGISTAAGAGSLLGTINGTRLSFEFNNITILDTDTGQITNFIPVSTMTKQWYKTTGSSQWTHNDDYSPTNSITGNVEKRSAIIYLVLDCSNSLSSTQISSIRTAASNFITSVYNQYFDITPVTSREIRIMMWDSSGDGWDNNAAVRVRVNGSDYTPYARLASGSGPAYYYFTANVGATVALYWVNGGQYDRECAYVVYYTSDPPVPLNESSSGSKVLLYKRYNSPYGAVGNGTLMGSFTVTAP